MPTRQLPDDPSFEHLRKDAKRLHKQVLAGQPDALVQVGEFHPRAKAAPGRFLLSDAQLTLARSYGFASWAALKQHLARIEPFVWNPPPLARAPRPEDMFIRLACLDYGSWRTADPERIARLLAEHPGVPRASAWTAAAAGDAAALGAMLDRDPTLVNARGGPLHWEPLLYACYSRVPATDSSSTLHAARLLLSRGADPNAGFLWAGRYLFTALTGAFGRGEDWDNQPPHPDCDALAALLLDAGADPNDSQTLYNRHFKSDDDHLKILFAGGLGQPVRGPWPKRLGDRAESPSRMLVQQLCWAAAHRFPARVRLLVEHGVDVNTPSLRDGLTPYQHALRAGDLAIADFLVRRGAAPLPLDPLETFALACIAGRRDEVQARLAADPSLVDRLGPHGRADMLHRAVEEHHYDAIRLMLALGLDINTMIPGSGLDRSVLHNAAGWGGLEMVRFLIDLGADPALRDPTYRATPLGWALHLHQHEVVAWLLPTANLFDAVRAGGVERVAELLGRDPSLAAAADEDGDSIVLYLHPGIARLDQMIRLLRERGADLNARRRDGSTLLDRAISGGAVDFADRLREHGARTAQELT
jgi:ankyrin repeat protein